MPSGRTDLASFSKLPAASNTPPRPRQADKLTERMAEYHSLVAGVKKGQVGRLVPGKGETARGVALRVSRAGNRVGKSVDAWVVDGQVYFKLT